MATATATVTATAMAMATATASVTAKATVIVAAVYNDVLGYLIAEEVFNRFLKTLKTARKGLIKMNCRERKEYEERIKVLEDKLDTRDRTIAVLRRRITKERKNRKAKRIDTIFTGFAIMMCGVGAIGFIYAMTSFAHWAEFGY